MQVDDVSFPKVRDKWNTWPTRSYYHHPSNSRQYYPHISPSRRYYHQSAPFFHYYPTPMSWEQPNEATDDRDNQLPPDASFQLDGLEDIFGSNDPQLHLDSADLQPLPLYCSEVPPDSLFGFLNDELRSPSDSLATQQYSPDDIESTSSRNPAHRHDPNLPSMTSRLQEADIATATAQATRSYSSSSGSSNDLNKKRKAIAQNVPSDAFAPGDRSLYSHDEQGYDRLSLPAEPQRYYFDDRALSNQKDAVRAVSSPIPLRHHRKRAASARTMEPVAARRVSTRRRLTTDPNVASLPASNAEQQVGSDSERTSADVRIEASTQEMDDAATSRAKAALETWYLRLRELIQYSNAYGDCNVPQKWPPNPALGIWVNKQRMEYRLREDGKRTSLTVEKLIALENIGFTWAKRKGQHSWDSKYAELLAYKEEHGDCLVPTKYAENPALGRWVSTQRSQFKKFQDGQPTAMTDERAAQLSALGFAWNMMG